VKTVETRAALDAALADARRHDRRIGLVPTMGYLHAGHLSLVDAARERCDVVVMSVFVNPLQFGVGEDLTTYPRDLERDAELASARGVDLLFAPTDREMYPDGEPAVQVVPTRMADRLCGAFRPGHFTGVLTVVCKLFNIVRPDLAVFGRKDFQQAVLIRRMARDLDLPVEIVVAPVVRADDGLALSSRNTYLDAGERDAAAAIWAGLSDANGAFGAGERRAEALIGRVRASVEGAGLRPQYVELVDADTLEPLETAAPGSVIAVAAFAGETRLIDNVVLG